MQWRSSARVFNRLNHIRPESVSGFTSAPNWHFTFQRRSFHFVAGNFNPSNPSVVGPQRSYRSVDGELVTSDPPVSAPQRSYRAVDGKLVLEETPIAVPQQSYRVVNGELILSDIPTPALSQPQPDLNEKIADTPISTRQRSYHFVDGRLVLSNTSIPLQPQPDLSEEIDENMASQELTQLQQLLGLITPKNGKPAEDVVFVCIDCEAFESDHSKITEIGKFSGLRELL